MIACEDSNKSLKAVYKEPNWLIRKKEQESKMKIFPFPELVTTDLPTPNTHSYGCARCDFQSIYKGYVVSHKEIQHEYGIFSCNQCDFQANYQIHVRDHKMYKHNDI